MPVLKLLLIFVYSVADVSQDSGVGGEAGLRAGDVLLAIQGRKIANMSAYRSCSSFFVSAEGVLILLFLPGITHAFQKC